VTVAGPATRFEPRLDAITEAVAAAAHEITERSNLVR
jgi:hypothetical protein